jgi:hypothetical protein
MASLEVNLTFHINLQEEVSKEIPWKDANCYIENTKSLMILVIETDDSIAKINLTDLQDLSIYEFNNRGTKDFLYEP